MRGRPVFRKGQIINMLWTLQVVAEPQRLEALIPLFEDMALSSSWFEYQEQEHIWCFQALFDELPEQTWIKEQLGDLSYEITQVVERDWVAENQASFPPLTLGCFYIYGSHITTPPPANLLSLKIDAASAFGTGEHFTTQGCLNALKQLHAQGYNFENVLDLGCGTGILGMACARLCPASHVILSDNDPQAIKVADYNVECNDLNSQVITIVSEGFENKDLQGKKFDLIFANILAGPLKELAPDIFNHCKTGAHIVLSGLLEHQAPDVIQAYTDQGANLMDHLIIKGWSTLILKVE